MTGTPLIQTKHLKKYFDTPKGSQIGRAHV